MIQKHDHIDKKTGNYGNMEKFKIYNVIIMNSCLAL